MKKIKTLFERDWNNKGKITDDLAVDFDFENAIATEKLDGMNVRVTIRIGHVVRLEKRRNPDKREKALGIEEPWYTDANINDPQDKWLYDALVNTNTLDLPDGEWSGEALGKNIQGNPLNLDKNTIVFFSLDQAPIFDNVPTTYPELKEWLPKQKSKFGNNVGIEGIVWHHSNGDMVKIKTKDFI